MSEKLLVTFGVKLDPSGGYSVIVTTPEGEITKFHAKNSIDLVRKLEPWTGDLMGTPE
jgi:hypothetical protein